MRIVLVFLFLLAAYASAQGKKVAIGVFGEEGTKFKAIKPLRQNFQNALSKEGKFKVIDNSAAILKLMRGEFEYEPGTMLSDDDARQIGDILKADYVCVLESSSTGDDSFWLNTNFVRVERGEASVVASVQSNLSNQQDVNRAVDDLINQLMKRPGGIFLDPSYKMNPLSSEFAKIFKKSINFKTGPCSANSMVIQIETGDWSCGGQNLITCSINVTLEGHGCTNEAQLHLKGTVKATDKNEKAAMEVAKRELLGGRPNFISDWIAELKPWVDK